MNSSNVNSIDPVAAGAETGVGSAWKIHSLFFAIVLASLAVLYFETYASIVRIWLSSDTYIHGFLILPLCAYLVYLQWPALKFKTPATYGPGLVAMIVLSVGWWLCHALGIQVGQQFISVALMPAAVVTIYGLNVSRNVSFALCYLLFAVPFGESLIPWLMDFTAWFTVGALELSGIPIFRDGRFFTIPAGAFEVAKACSGIRYLIAAVALGALYAYMIYESNYKRLIFIVFSIVLAIAANGVRAYGIVLIAHFSDMRLAVGVDHIIYGWLFFGFVIGVMFWVGNKFRDDQTPFASAAPATSGETNSDTSLRLVVITGLMVASLSLGPLLMPDRSAANDLAVADSASLPIAIQGWKSDVPYVSVWRPSYSGESDRVLARYASNNGIVDLAVLHYRDHSQDSELANARNFIADPDEWDVRRTAKFFPAGDDVGTDPVLATVVYGNLERRLIWYWYEVNNTIATSTFGVKLLETRALLKGEPIVSTLVAMSTTFTDEPGQAESVLNQFYSAARNPIRDCLRIDGPGAACRSVSRITE